MLALALKPRLQLPPCYVISNTEVVMQGFMMAFVQFINALPLMLMEECI